MTDGLTVTMKAEALEALDQFTGNIRKVEVGTVERNGMVFVYLDDTRVWDSRPEIHGPFYRELVEELGQSFFVVSRWKSYQIDSLWVSLASENGLETRLRMPFAGKGNRDKLAGLLFDNPGCQFDPASARRAIDKLFQGRVMALFGELCGDWHK